MLNILKQILALLQLYFEERRREQLALRLAQQQDVWLDAGTVKQILRVGDRMLYNYVQQGKLICTKRGLANYYLEASVMALKKGN